MIKKNVLLLSLVLFFKALAVAWFVAKGYIGLGPDEAQYWTWSQQLDWGYYSKPPGIAWQIWLGTLAFGNSELGVRAGAIAMGTFLPLAVYALASRCRLKPATATIAAIAFALTPMGMMSSFLAITDSGMVLFWTLATAAFCNFLNRNSSAANDDKERQTMYAIGALILCGALFKWPIYLFWIFVIGWQLLHRQRLGAHLFGGIALSSLGLLPSIVWNSQHEWSTFRHVSATINNNANVEIGTTELMSGNFWNFLGAQAILLSPIVFILLLLAAWLLIRRWHNVPTSLQFCGSTALILIGVYSAQSLFKKMQGNWCDFAYPAAIVLICWYACEAATKARSWLFGGLALSLGMILLLLSVPKLQSEGMPSCCHIPYKSNPFKHNLGWNRLEDGLTATGYRPDEHFLFADRYQTCSILSFYGPKQKRAYFFNLQGIRKNQFSYWPGMEIERKGATGFFVVTENSPHLEQGIDREPKRYLELLQPYFATVEFLGVRPLFYSYGSVAKGTYIFKCIDYNGTLPPETDLY